VRAAIGSVPERLLVNGSMRYACAPRRTA